MSSALQQPPTVPKVQGGKGVTGHATKEEDEVLTLIPARSLDTMLFFSDHGKVYSEKVYQIPDADRTAKGIPLVNVLSLDAGEIITAAVSVPNFESCGIYHPGNAQWKDQTHGPVRAGRRAPIRDHRHRAGRR